MNQASDQTATTVRQHLIIPKAERRGIFLHVTAETHAQVKATAAQKQVSMNLLINNLIEQGLSE